MNKKIKNDYSFSSKKFNEFVDTLKRDFENGEIDREVMMQISEAYLKQKSANQKNDMLKKIKLGISMADKTFKRKIKTQYASIKRRKTHIGLALKERFKMKLQHNLRKNASQNIQNAGKW